MVNKRFIFVSVAFITGWILLGVKGALQTSYPEFELVLAAFSLIGIGGPFLVMVNSYDLNIGGHMIPAIAMMTAAMFVFGFIIMSIANMATSVAFMVATVGHLYWLEKRSLKIKPAEKS